MKKPRPGGYKLYLASSLPCSESALGAEQEAQDEAQNAVPGIEARPGAPLQLVVTPGAETRQTRRLGGHRSTWAATPGSI